jgi:hypothetical protein
MNYHHAPEADGTAKTRKLLAEETEELERLEIEASQAFRRKGERITTREILGTLRKQPVPRTARPPELPTGRLRGPLLEALESFRRRWAPQELALLARQLRDFADSLEER